MKRPTPDRFERMVERVGINDGPPFHRGLSRNNVLKLLRRQHAAMVRQVKRMKTIPQLSASIAEGYQKACDDLLAYLMKK